MTGGTGFLGSHFLCWAREIGRPAVFALVRGASVPERERRLREAIAVSAMSYERPRTACPPQLTTIGGHIERPLCGVSRTDRATLRAAGVAEVWHFAACLRFDEQCRGRILSANVDGARNAAVLAGALGAKRFIFISSAYSVGAIEGLSRETLHFGARGFCNTYEASKFAAEHQVTRACAAHGVALTIFRPSIVLGPSCSKSSGGSQSGLYGFIPQLARLKARLARQGSAVRITADPETEINFIPVDRVMQDLKYAAARGFAPGPVFHLCATKGPTARAALQIISVQLGIENLELISDVQASSPLAALLTERLRFFHAYACLQRRFERSLPQKWVVTEEDLCLYVRNALPARARATEAGREPA